MDLKLVSKKNMGIVATLMLVILLSQSKILNFLFDTFLGRAFLILCIIFISYTNKILGIVSVLFAIIMFNNSGISIMEGFDPSGNQMNKTDIQNKVQEVQQKKEQSKQAVVANVQAQQAAAAATETETTTTAAEGFDILGTENNIKRGKQSNSIPVADHMRESMDVSPFETNSFSENFALY